jgi:hypothetical protein
LGIRGERGPGKIAKRGTSSFVLLAKYYSGDKIKKNEMGWAWGTYGGEERCKKGLVGKP